MPVTLIPNFINSLQRFNSLYESNKNSKEVMALIIEVFSALASSDNLEGSKNDFEQIRAFFEKAQDYFNSHEISEDEVLAILPYIQYLKYQNPFIDKHRKLSHGLIRAEEALLLHMHPENTLDASSPYSFLERIITQDIIEEQTRAQQLKDKSKNLEMAALVGGSFIPIGLIFLAALLAATSFFFPLGIIGGGFLALALATFIWGGLASGQYVDRFYKASENLERLESYKLLLKDPRFDGFMHKHWIGPNISAEDKAIIYTHLDSLLAEKTK